MKNLIELEVMINITHIDIINSIKPLQYITEDYKTGIQSVSEYYEVPISSIKSVIQRNYNIFLNDGVEVFMGDELKSIKKKYKLIHPRTNRAFSLFTPKCVIRIGIYLNNSIVADQIKCCIIKSENKELIEMLNGNNIHMFDERKEIIFGKNVLLKMFNGLCTIIPQYSIDSGKYRIDYYVPELELAIEYDENYHNNQSYRDKIRQKYIKNKLNCEFIRISENDDCYTIFNKMLKIVIAKRNQGCFVN